MFSTNREGLIGPKRTQKRGSTFLSYTMGNTWQVQLEGLALALLTLDMFV